jgi:hypothetical protein
MTGRSLGMNIGVNFPANNNGHWNLTRAGIKIICASNSKQKVKSFPKNWKFIKILENKIGKNW